jgi:hypothetical protein
MSEATTSLAQARKLVDDAFLGYDTYLDERFAAVLPGCLENRTKIVSNQGWIDPDGAARRVVELLRSHGARQLTVASVSETPVADVLFEVDAPLMENGRSVRQLDRGRVLTAETYLGAEPIVEALHAGADVVLTGRVADPSLFLAPMIFEFGWSLDAWAVLGQGAGIGHLLECGSQVTGGYFADPGYKDVPDLWNLGLPIAEVASDGSAVITKLNGTGGIVSRETVLEQMFYEIQDPAAYQTPDVVVDFTSANVADLGQDRVAVTGIGGSPRPSSLKVSVGVAEGYIGEDLFFYAGPGALQRASLARDVLLRRLSEAGLSEEMVQIDFIGRNSVHGGATPSEWPEPWEVGVRVAARASSRAEAALVGREVDGMAVSGVGMTGKRLPIADRTRAVVGVYSALLDRSTSSHSIQYLDV